MTPTTETLLQVPPEQLVGDDNARFGLIQARIDAMAESILQEGGIQTPLTVEVTDDADVYRITDGHYRHAAATKLNTEGAGLLCPVIVRTMEDPIRRLKYQLMTNLERQDMTPMDKAAAISKLLEAGVPRAEIRNIFRTVGGRKGMKNQPLSNSMLNIMVSFLDLPKPIQQKIHEGSIGVAAAYEITKVAPDKRAAVLQRAEEDRAAEEAKAAKEEEKFLEAERKEAERNQKEKEQEELVLKQKAALEAAEEQVRLKAEAATAAHALTRKGAKDDETKSLLTRAFKDAEAAATAAEKEREKIAKELAKAQEKLVTAAAQAKERAKKLELARKQAEKDAKNKKTVGPTDIRKAAVAAGGEAKPLNAADMRRAVDEWALDGGNPKALSIGRAIKACFSGEPGCPTPAQVYKIMLIATGESITQKPKPGVAKSA
jgi:ParB/RepB/Spo0J family partition protein